MDPFLSKKVLMAPARTAINLLLLYGNQDSTGGRTHDSNKADFRQSPIRTDLALAQLQENAACGQCDKTVEEEIKHWALVCQNMVRWVTKQ